MYDGIDSFYACDGSESESLTTGIQKILEGVLANGAAMAGGGGGEVEEVAAAKVMNNLDWFGSMGFLEFLREVGKYARVGTMMAKDSVKTRLESEQARGKKGHAHNIMFHLFAWRHMPRLTLDSTRPPALLPATVECFG